MYTLSYYIPQSEHERVKQALFKSGAGSIGQYEHCSWEVLGYGQFRAQKGSNPYIGQVGKLQKLVEYKVEMVCSNEQIHNAVKTLIKEHPYEQPAYFFSRVMTLEDL